ncbi:MAG: hypothetical protein WC761_00875 [Candidatus Paceibacterota bacterium]|jgi:hypothetical protein
MLPYYWFITAEKEFKWICGYGRELPDRARLLGQAISQKLLAAKTIDDASDIAENILKGEDYYNEAIKSWQTKTK